MDEARAVLDRLGRIEELERAGAPAGELLDELRALIGEAETWVRREGPGAEDARDAVDRAQAALEEVHQPA
jgi:broad specificity phosphatase PhoE